MEVASEDPSRGLWTSLGLIRFTNLLNFLKHLQEIGRATSFSVHPCILLLDYCHPFPIPTRSLRTRTQELVKQKRLNPSKDFVQLCLKLSEMDNHVFFKRLMWCLAAGLEFLSSSIVINTFSLQTDSLLLIILLPLGHPSTRQCFMTQKFIA